MAQEVNEEKIWELIGFIKVSPTRYKTLKTLKRDFLMRTTQISNALSDMKEKNLVVCMNESAHKGRLYQNTDLGLEILERLDREE